MYHKPGGCARAFSHYRAGVFDTHCADDTSLSPQVLSLAVAVSSPAVHQPAEIEMRRSESSVRQGNSCKSAMDARGKKAGTRAVLLFAMGALLLRGVTASETNNSSLGCVEGFFRSGSSGTGIYVKAIITGWLHTCAIMVRK